MAYALTSAPTYLKLLKYLKNRQVSFFYNKDALRLIILAQLSQPQLTLGGTYEQI